MCSIPNQTIQNDRFNKNLFPDKEYNVRLWNTMRKWPRKPFAIGNTYNNTLHTTIDCGSFWEILYLCYKTKQSSNKCSVNALEDQ